MLQKYSPRSQPEQSFANSEPGTGLAVPSPNSAGPEGDRPGIAHITGLMIALSIPGALANGLTGAAQSPANLASGCAAFADGTDGVAIQ